MRPATVCFLGIPGVEKPIRSGIPSAPSPIPFPISIMRPLPTAAAVLLTLGLATAMVVQHRRIQQLARELDTVRMETGLQSIADEPEEPSGFNGALGSRSEAPVSRTDSSVLRRLASIEEALAQLTESNEYLMNRGQLPLSAEKRQQLLAQLTNPFGDDKERLQALRLLRRNNGLEDDALQAALGFLNGSTNGDVRMRLLQQLGGLTNTALRDPLLSLAMSDPNVDVRKRAMGNLRRLVDDPQVESQMWSLLLQDPDEGVRRQARDVLVGGPVSESRAAALRERANSATSTLDERTLAWEALKASGQSAPEISAALSQLAQTTTDSRERLQLFEAFNDASDPAFIPPLVQGLQDPSPLVRAKAADALSDFRTDPTIESWYRYLAENDTDSSVRRQAMRVLSQGSRPTRQGQGQRPPGRGRP